MSGIGKKWHDLVDPMKVTVTANAAIGKKGLGGVFISGGVTASAVDAKTGKRDYSDYGAIGVSTPVGYAAVVHTKDGFTPAGGVSLPYVSVGTDPITGKTLYISVFGVGSASVGSKGAIGLSVMVPVAPGVSVGPAISIVDPRLAKYTEPVVQKAVGWAEAVEPALKKTLEEFGKAAMNMPVNYAMP